MEKLLQSNRDVATFGIDDISARHFNYQMTGKRFLGKPKMTEYKKENFSVIRTDLFGYN